MSNSESVNRLQQRLADMVTLEIQNAEILDQGLTQIRGHEGAAETVERLQTMVGAQREALRNRLLAIGGKDSHSGETNPVVSMRQSISGSDNRVAALHGIHTALNHAAFGYGIIHATAHRFFDVETADLAEAHLRAYTGAVQEVNQLIADVVVRELGKEGLDCQCSCPSCQLGVCVCAPHGTATVMQAWVETAPATAEEGVILRSPRANSAVDNSDLREGDVILAVDDQAIGSVPQLQAAIRDREPGQEMKFQIRRGQDSLQEVTVVRSE